jgi:pimeloyl-[acyl-carrier protein] methyl ester esterase
MSHSMVFLHGWGQSKQIWHRQMERFPDATFLNLPGHGGVKESNDWIETIAKQLPESPTILVGWSLGGIVAMQLALQYPDKVAGLVLVSTTPSFCNRQGWEQGCDNELFDAFESGVKSNSPKTMSRFFALMLRGNDISRSQYNQLAKEVIDKASPPSTATLEKGLNHLASTDLRKDMQGIAQPALVVHGQDDVIVPVAAGEWITEALPHAESHLFDTCGHAPFLMQSNQFNEILESWCHKI